MSSIAQPITAPKARVTQPTTATAVSATGEALKIGCERAMR